MPPPFPASLPPVKTALETVDTSSATDVSGVAMVTAVDNGGTANGGGDTSTPQCFTISVIL